MTKVGKSIAKKKLDRYTKKKSQSGQQAFTLVFLGRQLNVIGHHINEIFTETQKILNLDELVDLNLQLK